MFVDDNYRVILFYKAHALSRFFHGCFELVITYMYMYMAPFLVSLTGFHKEAEKSN